MEIQVINLGNTKGIRLPKAILEQYYITDIIELILEKEGSYLNLNPFQERAGKNLLSKCMPGEMTSY